MGRWFYSDLVCSFNGVDKDDNVRADSSLEKLKRLRPCFERSERGTLTAADSTPLTDGAATVLMGTVEWGQRHGRASSLVTHSQSAAVDYESERWAFSLLRHLRSQSFWTKRDTRLMISTFLKFTRRLLPRFSAH